MQKYILAFLITLITLPTIAVSNEVQDVRVINLPETQNIEGSVAIEGPIAIDGLIKHSFLDKREAIVIHPVLPDNIENLKPIGTIETDGFTSIIISLQGEVQSQTFTAGTVGVILIPSERPIYQAFKNDGATIFSLELNVDVTPEKHSYFESRYFSAQSSEHTIGFPKYSAYLYNSTNKTVEVNLYSYLTN